MKTHFAFKIVLGLTLHLKLLEALDKRCDSTAGEKTCVCQTPKGKVDLSVYGLTPNHAPKYGIIHNNVNH